MISHLTKQMFIDQKINREISLPFFVVSTHNLKEDLSSGDCLFDNNHTKETYRPRKTTNFHWCVDVYQPELGPIQGGRMYGRFSTFII